MSEYAPAPDPEVCFDAARTLLEQMIVAAREHRKKIGDTVTYLRNKHDRLRYDTPWPPAGRLPAA